MSAVVIIDIAVAAAVAVVRVLAIAVASAFAVDVRQLQKKYCLSSPTSRESVMMVFPPTKMFSLVGVEGA